MEGVSSLRWSLYRDLQHDLRRSLRRNSWALYSYLSMKMDQLVCLDSSLLKSALFHSRNFTDITETTRHWSMTSDISETADITETRHWSIISDIAWPACFWYNGDNRHWSLTNNISEPACPWYNGNNSSLKYDMWHLSEPAYRWRNEGHKFKRRSYRAKEIFLLLI